MTDHEKALVAKSEKWGYVDDVRHDQTKQRVFEQAFLSLDWPDENGTMRDYGEGGRQARKLYRYLDREHDMNEKWKLFSNALEKLNGHPELEKTLWAILEHREKSERKMRRFRIREKIFFALKIKASTYTMRREELKNLLQISI